jgi:hypothetical protein
MRPTGDMTTTADGVIGRFSRAFQERDATLLEDIIAPGCAMESIQPAPGGTRYEGYDASFSSWKALIDDTTSHFEVEDAHTGEEWALIRWRYLWGPAPAIRSVASTSCGSSTARSSRPPATQRPRRPSPPWRADRPVTTVNANQVALGIESFGDDDAPLVLLAGGTTMLSWPGALCERPALGDRPRRPLSGAGVHGTERLFIGEGGPDGLACGTRAGGRTRRHRRERPPRGAREPSGECGHRRDAGREHSTR